MARRKHNCKICGKPGHNARTCKAKPQKPKPQKKIKRDKNGCWVKGTRGNPGGRTKEHTKARERLREYIRGKIETSKANKIVDRLIEIAERSIDHHAAIKAGQVLLDHAYGKPPTIAELDSGNGDDDSGQVIIIGGTKIRF